MAAVGSPLGSIASLAKDIWLDLQYQVLITSYKVGSKPNLLTVGYLKKYHYCDFGDILPGS